MVNYFLHLIFLIQSTIAYEYVLACKLNVSKLDGLLQIIKQSLSFYTNIYLRLLKKCTIIFEL